ncbi:MAG: hypothetical protein Athens071426_458 [Parcubacteria group bacterium Athens0714_26]|nr:MAG: hypothetical protein Athens101426_201 [Parcubacteria group bacterium Athens1014_26]TSD02584.1 MAG: hypothetical protein Athens071426_458 [Parcubacteria group bacterium Athens0714_26]
MPKKKKELSFWERVEKISRQVDRWPKLKQNLGGFGSNYCSELQPLRGESQEETEKRTGFRIETKVIRIKRGA